MRENSFICCEEKSGTGCLLPPARYENALELLMVDEGSVFLGSAMSGIQLHAGSMVFISPNMVRYVEAEEGNASLRVLRFTQKVAQGMQEAVDEELIYMFLTQARNGHHVLTPEDRIYISVRQYFEDCYGEFLSRELCYSLRIRGYLTLLLAEVISTYFTTRSPGDRAVYHNVMRLKPCLDYIDSHLNDKITVPALAEQLSVTPDYFTKLFRDSIGKTTVDYVNCVRINAAMAYLVESKLPISEIAEMTGLGSGNYLSKVFRRATNGRQTPLSFRNMK